MRKNFSEAYVINTRDIRPRPGCSALDEVQLSGRRSLLRTYEEIAESEEKTYQRNPLTILCQGAALSTDCLGYPCHFEGGKFLGFLLGNSENHVTVKTRGSVVLQIPGASDDDRGRGVYVTGANDFSLSKSHGAVEIGKIRFFQNGRCAVAFKRTDDARPLNLSV